MYTLSVEYDWDWEMSLSKIHIFAVRFFLFVYSKFKRYFQLTKIQLQVSALKSLEQYIITFWFSSSDMDSII